jgi:hypothetical protein
MKSNFASVYKKQNIKRDRLIYEARMDEISDRYHRLIYEILPPTPITFR